MYQPVTILEGLRLENQAMLSNFEQQVQNFCGDADKI